uniref:Interleukin-20 receptor subunit alpha n=1 Tax=Castor canadensis TaxID=51338 RepID=A0A8C0WEE0_CASCN
MRVPGSQAPGRPALRLPLLLLLLLVMMAATWGRAVPCVSGGLPKPMNITFVSINMKNVLQWAPPEGLQGVEVTYTVQYFIYGQKKWLSKSKCKNINRTYCDLSAETSDYEHQYYAKVKAMWGTNCSKWVETGRFYPFLETQIGPPEVSLTTGEKSISIVLTAPEKWKRNPEDSSVSMQQIYSNLKYNVSMYNTKSKRMWSQCITNHTLVLSWLEPNTLYCISVESFVPGPPRLTRPSQKQCVSTLEDQTSGLKVKIIFWYVLPISVTIFLFSVIGYSIYRYIHVGKQKHPATLILIYGHEFDKRFFMPAEKLVDNFIALNILDDSKVSQKERLNKSRDGLNLNDPESCQSPEPHPEVKHLGYTSHVMEILCDTGDSSRGASLTQQEWLGSSRPTTEYEYNVRADLGLRLTDHQLSVQEEEARQGSSSEPQAALANGDQQLSDLGYMAQEYTGPEEGLQEEPSTTLVDWDPRTGRLCIPLLSSFDQDPEGCEPYKGGPLTGEGLLSRLYEQQVPDKPPEENENYLMQFMEKWELCVQMGNE